MRMAGMAGGGNAARRLDRFAKGVDLAIEWLGRATAWLTLLLVLMVAFDVGARYLFRVSWVSQQELEWHLLAVIALISASYTLQQGEHVRVDVFYQHYSERVKRWLDVILPLAVVVPVAGFIAIVSLKFVAMSYSIGEGSPDPGGLPARWALKAFVPLGFALVALQGLAMAALAFLRLRRGE